MPWQPPVQEFDDSENGHKVIADKISASADAWAALNKKGKKPKKGTGFPLALVADQDEAAAGAEGWTSFLRYGKLVYNGEAGAASYSIDLPGEQPLRTKRGDKAGRGAEYSALEIFSGRMITADDRTGCAAAMLPMPPMPPQCRQCRRNAANAAAMPPMPQCRRCLLAADASLAVPSARDAYEWSNAVSRTITRRAFASQQPRRDRPVRRRLQLPRPGPR